MGIKDWACQVLVSIRTRNIAPIASTLTNLSSAEIQEKGVAAEYPTCLRFRHASQLVIQHPRLKDGKRIEKAHRRYHCAPSTQDSEPCFSAPFRVLILLIATVEVCQVVLAVSL